MLLTLSLENLVEFFEANGDKVERFKRRTLVLTLPYWKNPDLITALTLVNERRGRRVCLLAPRMPHHRGQLGLPWPLLLRPREQCCNSHPSRITTSHYLVYRLPHSGLSSSPP